MIYHDQHIHSCYSKDSKEPYESYYQKAVENGCDYVITCEHFDLHTTVDGTTWEADYQKIKEEQQRLKEKYPTITPLIGIELGYREKYLDEMNAKLKENDYDLVQLSIHDDEYDYYFSKYFTDTVKSLNDYFSLMKHAVETFFDYDVLSHIDFAYKTALQVDKDLKISKFEHLLIPILEAIIKNKKALEINTKVQSAINDENHIRYILNLYKKLGGTRITLSSDAHDKSKYMYKFEEMKKIIKECGFNNLSYYIKRKEYLYPL